MKKTIQVNTADFETIVLQSPVPVMVDFWQTGCHPSRYMAPVIDEIAVESAERFRIAKVNVDDEPELREKFGIRVTPTLIFFSKGEQRHQFFGMKSKIAILNKLEALAE
jgi:thioredoxin 1